ncbi:MAG: replication-associated recombination protein A [Bdellovibrionia bacterium]
MRPQSLEEFFGHSQVLGPGKPLRRWIEMDRVSSLLFWGPPGCGKTTLAGIIAQKTHSYFESLSAVLSGVKEVKDAVLRAQERKRVYGKKTLLFVDELHRFNRSQQDALLPHVESGTFILLGATTENPSFELNAALLSRLKVIRLEPLDSTALVSILERALGDPNRGLGRVIQISAYGLLWLAEQAQGDARRALNSLEALASFFASELTQSRLAQDGSESNARDDASKQGLEPLSQPAIQEAYAQVFTANPIRYDSTGEEHHAVSSALIKSIRDSDPQAAIYYLARMLEGGEDPLWIVRRLVILASEDIGNADPRALSLAVAAKEAVEFVGMPEARIPLAQLVSYLSVAPKSYASYQAIESALEIVRQTGALPVPLHLRNPVTPAMRAQGYGQGYCYPHGPSGYQSSGKSHLPEALRGQKFYHPQDSGLEKQIRAQWNLRKCSSPESSEGSS